MRLICAAMAAVLAWGTTGAAAQVGDARRAQVDAAVANAVEGLYREVSRSPVHGRVTVGELVDKVGGREDLIRTLQGAQEIGGPRWLDDQTAQVRLEIAGTRVAQTVVQLAASNPRRTPVKADALAPLLAEWERKTFGAVGTSTGAAGVVDLRPAAEDPAWARVPEQSRRAAIAAARANAAVTVVEGLRQVELKPGWTVGRLMDPEGSPVRSAVERYLAERPVTGVQFKPDQQVEVGLAVPGQELAEVLRAAVQGTGEPALADVDWARVTEQVVRTVGPGLGRAMATVGVDDAPSMIGTGGSAVKIPSVPPEWVWRQVDADASARSGGSPLKCARAAEQAAVAKLRSQIEALTLDGMTIGEAGKKDPRVAEGVARGVSRARVYKTDYHADGTVTVYVSMELRDVWEQLRQL